VRLYHGTGEAAARDILVNGLISREDAASNWEVESRDDLVYLTDAYAPYFATQASGEGERYGLVEVEVDPGDLLPDEDFLEQVTRGQDVCPLTGMVERTEWYRERLEGFAHHALDSLKGLGNAAHPGVLAVDVTRVVLFDPKAAPVFAWMAIDPSISVLNYRLMGDKYRGLTRALAGYSVTVDEVLGRIGVLGFPPEERLKLQGTLDALPNALEILFKK